MGSDVFERHPDRGNTVRGVVVMTVFGCVWALVAVSGLDVPTAAVVILVLLAVVVTAAVLITTTRFVARLPAHAGTGRTVSPTAGKYFHLVNAAQTVVIVVAVFALVRAGQVAFVPVVTCLVVGAHFLPLARIFDLPLYRWTGLALILTAAVVALAVAQGLSAEQARVGVGLPAASVLWGTAMMVTRRG